MRDSQPRSPIRMVALITVSATVLGGMAGLVALHAYDVLLSIGNGTRQLEHLRTHYAEFALRYVLSGAVIGLSVALAIAMLATIVQLAVRRLS